MEFQVPSPLVPTRESYFVRYCKNNPDGTWAVVDVSLDSLRPSPVIKCRRRPSGCLIQEMPNGYSKVISEHFPSCWPASLLRAWKLMFISRAGDLGGAC
jgi:hypothetical protein